MTDDLPVYRKIEGKLVRVPGDKRDPHRRYKSVATPEGNYHLEFTDEEEKQRDADEAKWEVERPQRERDAQMKLEKEKSFKDSLQYEDRVVAFLDILGSRNMIDKSSSNPELTRDLGIAISSFQQHEQMAKWTTQHGGEERWPGDLQVTVISDGIVLSVFVAESGRHSLITSLITLVGHVRMIVDNLINLELLVRGGIARGQLIHRGSFAYGPALVKAHDLESKHAIYPRIILDPSLAKECGQGNTVSHQDGSLIGVQKTWREDFDGFSYYDHLQPFAIMPGDKVDGQKVDRTLTPYRNLIIRGLGEFESKLGIFPKYKWGAKYFNEVLSEYPQSTLERI